MYDELYVCDKRSSQKISKDKQDFIESVIDRFGRDSRRFQRLLQSDADKSS